MTELGEVAVKGQRRLVTLGFISLDGEPLPLHTEYVMEDDGMLGLPDGEKHVAYLLGAGRPIDGFLNSILGTADAVQEEFEEHHQFQLV